MSLTIQAIKCRAIQIDAEHINNTMCRAVLTKTHGICYKLLGHTSQYALAIQIGPSRINNANKFIKQLGHTSQYALAISFGAEPY